MLCPLTYIEGTTISHRY